MGNIVEMVEDRTQRVLLTTIANIITPRIELAARLINASSGREAASVTANAERGEHLVITASFETYPIGTTHFMD